MEEIQVKDIKYPEETKRANCKRILKLYAKNSKETSSIFIDKKGDK